MELTRREFVRGGVAAFTVGFAAPAFLSELALAQGAASRNLVVLYLGGGNDALSTLIPYTDSFYYSRRPSTAVPAGNVLPIGADRDGTALGLHPRLAGLRSIYDAGHLAIIQRTGYQDPSRSHFQGNDIWSTATPDGARSTGWLGRFLDTLPSPVDPLVCWNTSSDTPRTLQGSTLMIPAIGTVSQYVFRGVNDTADTVRERDAALRMASHVPVGQPHVAFVSGNAKTAFTTLERVASVGRYTASVPYPANGFGRALLAIAGALATGIGTKVFWVQTGGYDTHAGQGTSSGTYANLMGTLNDGLLAFYTDLNNQGLFSNTLVMQYSEFGRRISENAGSGTDHGAAGLMLAMGGAVQGGLYGTAASLNPSDSRLENNGNDVRFETDFRAVYARVIDSWLGGDSVEVLGGDFRSGAPAFI